MNENFDIYAMKAVDSIHAQTIEKWDRMTFWLSGRLRWWEILAEYV